MINLTLSDKLKFALIILVAGTGWSIIPQTISYVGTEYAIAYRMILAGLFVAFFALHKKIPFPKRSLKNVVALLIAGSFLYSLNYLFIYKALTLLPSGICALIISAVIIPNAFLSRFILKTPLTPQMILGAGLSFGGLVVLFPGDVFNFDFSHGATVGFFALFISLFLSSFGTVYSSKIMKGGLDIYWTSSLSMLIGGFVALAYGFYQHQEFFWNSSATFLGLIVYVSFVVTAVVFLFYMQIVNKFGAGNASYVWVIAPVIALNISSSFEGMEWNARRIAATLVILVGGFILLKKPSRKAMVIKV